MQNLISRFLLTLVSIVALFSASLAYADPSADDFTDFFDVVSCTKTYVYPEQVHFIENHIVVELEPNMMFLTNALYQDGGGIFIAAKSKEGKDGCSRWEYKCGNCGTCNRILNDYCTNCKYPITGSK